MKKFLYPIATLCAAFFCTFDGLAQSDDTGLFFKVDGISYAVYVYMNPNEDATVVAGDSAYEGDIVIPESVTYNEKTYKVARIGDNAFYGKTSLESITIPRSVNYIGKNAFNKCSQLKGVCITDLKAWCNTEFVSNPLSQAHNLYLNGSLVRHLQFPPDISSIPDMAFMEAECIESVVLPESLTAIGVSAFSCTGIKELIIPESVVSIANYAFYNNTSLRSVWLPSTLQELGGYAFAQCKSLKEMWVKASFGTKVTMGKQPFYSSLAATEGILYVPTGSLYTYQNKDGWGEWKQIQEQDMLEVSRTMKVDIFRLPYGEYDNEGRWKKVDHLDSSYIFYGNNISKDNCVDLTGYDYLKLHGKKGQSYFLYVNGEEAMETVLDDNGNRFVDLSEFGDKMLLRGIRITRSDDPEKQEKFADDAYVKVIRFLEEDEGIVVSGSGTFPETVNNHTIYDISGLTGTVSLSLANPNALIIGGDPESYEGLNILARSNEVEQGFTAESLSITDGYDFCYGYSVKCPKINFTRNGITAEDQYATVILPFAVDASKGTYQYVDCDGKNIYFNSTSGTIPAYTPLLVNVESMSELTLSGEDLQALTPSGTFNLTDAPSSTNNMKYGFVTKRQEGVSLSENEEVNSYNVYGYSVKTHRFVRATNTFTINPFRAFFLLPKSMTPVKGFAAPASAPSSLNIVIDGKNIDDTPTVVDNVLNGEEMTDDVTYNMFGIPVGPTYRGIAIRNGKKIIMR